MRWTAVPIVPKPGWKDRHIDPIAHDRGLKFEAVETRQSDIPDEAAGYEGSRKAKELYRRSTSRRMAVLRTATTGPACITESITEPTCDLLRVRVMTSISLETD
jgi:hypothetical protein